MIDVQDGCYTHAVAQPIDILRTGTFSDANGQRVTLGADDLADLASTYNPALHEAPLVVGHPKLNAPAYGWVKSVTHDAAGLHAPHQVDTEFAELVRAGRFRKVSVALYSPSIRRIIPALPRRDAGI